MLKWVIVIPCYNEADRLDADKFVDFVDRHHGAQFVFVNDGSTDRTVDILNDLVARGAGEFHLLDLPRNVGKAEAVRRGILHAGGFSPQVVGFWDADLSTPLEAIPELCQALDADPQLMIVMGSRVKLLGRTIQRSPWRHCPGRVFATLASLVLRLPIYDTQCGAKVFRATSFMLGLFEKPFRTNWIFDVELLARFLRDYPDYPDGSRVAAERALSEFPLMTWRDVGGSKLKLGDYFRAAVGLASIYWHDCRRAGPEPHQSQPDRAPSRGAVEADGAEERRAVVADIEEAD